MILVHAFPATMVMSSQIINATILVHQTIKFPIASSSILWDSVAGVLTDTI